MAKARRENGAGTEPKQEVNGRWSLQISYRDVETDEPKRTTIRGASQGEVLEKKKAFLKAIASGVKPNNKKTTLLDWLNTWLEVNKKSAVADRTYFGLRNIIIKHITGSDLSKISLDKVKRVDIQKFLNEKAGSVAPGFLLNIKLVLSDALNVAEIDSLIVKTPCKNIKLPKVEVKKINPLSREEVTVLLNIAGTGTMLYVIIFLALRTGMRIGEVLGIRWEDIDFKKKVITVRQQAKIEPTKEKLEERLILGTLKTDSSYRTIPLDTKLAEELKRYKTEQAKGKLLMGESYKKLNLVFAEADGSIVSPQTIKSRFSSIMNKTGIPRRTFHELRHTFASVAISQGISINAISKTLGHSKTSTTLDVYGHLLPGDIESVIHAVATFYDS